MKQVILMLLLLPLAVCGQTDYYRYNQSTGTSEKVGYSTPTNSTPAFAPYRGIDLSLYEKAGRHKQDSYDRNSTDIQTRIYNVSKSIRIVCKLDAVYCSSINRQFDELIDGINKQKLDYSNGRTYQMVASAIQQYQDAVDNRIDEIVGK